eukprot:Nk52_evm16s278 gene=Nk52_evmTU16s278
MKSEYLTQLQNLVKGGDTSTDLLPVVLANGESVQEQQVGIDALKKFVFEAQKMKGVEDLQKGLLLKDAPNEASGQLRGLLKTSQRQAKEIAKEMFQTSVDESFTNHEMHPIFLPHTDQLSEASQMTTRAIDKALDIHSKIAHIATEENHEASSNPDLLMQEYMQPLNEAHAKLTAQAQVVMGPEHADKVADNIMKAIQPRVKKKVEISLKDIKSDLEAYMRRQVVPGKGDDESSSPPSGSSYTRVLLTPEMVDVFVNMGSGVQEYETAGDVMIDSMKELHQRFQLLTRGYFEAEAGGEVEANPPEASLMNEAFEKARKDVMTELSSYSKDLIADQMDSAAIPAATPQDKANAASFLSVYYTDPLLALKVVSKITGKPYPPELESSVKAMKEKILAQHMAPLEERVAGIFRQLTQGDEESTLSAELSHTVTEVQNSAIDKVKGMIQNAGLTQKVREELKQRMSEIQLGTSTNDEMEGGDSDFFSRCLEAVEQVTDSVEQKSVVAEKDRLYIVQQAKDQASRESQIYRQTDQAGNTMQSHSSSPGEEKMRMSSVDGESQGELSPQPYSPTDGADGSVPHE